MTEEEKLKFSKDLDNINNEYKKTCKYYSEQYEKSALSDYDVFVLNESTGMAYRMREKKLREWIQSVNGACHRSAQEVNRLTFAGEIAKLYQLKEDKEIKTYKLSDFDLFDNLRLSAQQFIENKATKTFIKEYELKDGVRIKTIFTRGKKND